MEEFLREIGITYKGKRNPNGLYVIELDENQWSRCLSSLERSYLVDEDEDSSNVSYESSAQIFDSDSYILTLIADLNSGVYKLTVKEKD